MMGKQHYIKRSSAIRWVHEEYQHYMMDKQHYIKRNRSIMDKHHCIKRSGAI